MRLLVALAASALLCSGLLALRMIYSGHDRYAFLAWNLVLAGIPLLLTFPIETAARRGLRLVVLPLGLLWVVFLPNAPYVITDFVHLAPAPPVPLWFDILLFTSFAATSLTLGFVSLYRLRRLADGRISTLAISLIVVALFAASSVAIYLGRFEQRNSWDLFVRPGTVVDELTSGRTAGRLAAVTAGFTAFLTVAYATFEAVIGLGAIEREPRAR
jgi:uncharacterized membrane protein